MVVFNALRIMLLIREIGSLACFSPICVFLCFGRFWVFGEKKVGLGEKVPLKRTKRNNNKEETKRRERERKKKALLLLVRWCAGWRGRCCVVLWT